jgi:AcrR family transcriptional regulator
MSKSSRGVTAPSPQRGAGRPAGSSGREGRAALLDAARSLLAETGVEGITLRAIAERAGVRAPLINYYFGSKEELFKEVVGSVSKEIRDRLADTIAADSPWELRFRAYITNLLRALSADPYAPRLVMEHFILPDNAATDEFTREVAQPQVAQLSALIHEGIQAGVLRPVDIRFMVPSMMGMCVFYFLSNPMLTRVFAEDMNNPQAVEAYGEHVCALLLNGILLTDHARSTAS